MRIRILASLFISACIYLIVSFVKWDIIWIIEIPNYENATRGLSLFCYLFLQTFGQFAVNDIFKLK